MTGQGQGQAKCGNAQAVAEVRSVNNRHLKVQARLGERFSTLEPAVEKRVKQKLRRGSLQIHVQLSDSESDSVYQIETNVLKSYSHQCASLQQSLGLEAVTWSDLLGLPGVISEQRNAGEPNPDLDQAVLSAVDDALDNLNEMRKAEGQSMATELERQLQELAELANAIEVRAPQVIEDYRLRLRTKIDSALTDVGTTIQDSDLIREVLLLADKVDIREEIVRLRSHFEQFASMLSNPESQGRKLDFLIQEMFRETNTIGSKANDAEIAQRVVDMKSILEQMRELVQNVE